jgi:hypothetical protein
MGIFSDQSELDPLQGRAESLVGTASTLAKSLFSRLAVYYTDLFQVSEEDWNFLVTVAGLYVASLRLYDEIPGDRGEEAVTRSPAGDGELRRVCDPESRCRE